MFVVVDMLHTITVVAIALGTVAEFQVRVLGVCFATNSTFVDVTFLLISGFGSFLKIHRLLGVLMLEAAFAVA